MGKYALIGDAAHAMVPFLGQGMNAGLEDCTVLDACLERVGCNWPEVFSSYAAQRKPDCDVITSLADEHYRELAVNVDDPGLLLRRRIEQRLHADHPTYIAPRYTLITFTSVPYGLVQTVAKRQEPLVDLLAEMPAVEERWHSPDVQDVIRRALDHLPPVPRERTGVEVPGALVAPRDHVPA
jgi:kynurenine 3-monooxygenase